MISRSGRSRGLRSSAVSADEVARVPAAWTPGPGGRVRRTGRGWCHGSKPTSAGPVEATAFSGRRAVDLSEAEVTIAVKGSHHMRENEDPAITPSRSTDEGVTPMTRVLELRLIGAPVPSGEIPAKDLAALAGALQELSTRIGRDIVNAPGPGRTKQFMEEFAQLRLRAVEPGSTLLTLSKGPTDKLDVDLPEQEAADDRFWDIVDGIKDDKRPDWATDLIAESAAKLVTAFRDAAPRVALSDSVHSAVEIESDRIHVETWTSKRVQTEAQMEARGRLEKVDLRSHEFRVRDDVGQSIDLKHVADDVDAAQHVGKWVIAVGEGILASNRLVALDNVSITLVDDPARVMADDEILTLEEILESAPGPSLTGGIELTHDEFAAFLEAAVG